jgi:hypothetical protein
MKKVTTVILLVIMALCVLTAGVLFSSNITKEWTAPAEVYNATFTASTSYSYATDIDLGGSGYEGAQIQIEYNSAGTTDDYIFSVFASLDDSTYDTEEYWTYRAPNNASAASQFTVVIRDIRYIRVGFKGTGATDNCDIIVTWSPWIWDYL